MKSAAAAFGIMAADATRRALRPSASFSPVAHVGVNATRYILSNPQHWIFWKHNKHTGLIVAGAALTTFPGSPAPRATAPTCTSRK